MSNIKITDISHVFRDAYKDLVFARSQIERCSDVIETARYWEEITDKEIELIKELCMEFINEVDHMDILVEKINKQLYMDILVEKINKQIYLDVKK